MTLSDGVLAQCPYCGEQVELTVEPVGPSSEVYVEDCQVCCRPWNVHVHRGDEDSELEVFLSREDA
jgi:hypothetical protein